MPVLEILEQRGLFRLTRFVAFIIVLFLTIGLLIGAAMFIDDFRPSHESHVSYSTISSELRPKPQTTEPAPSESEPQRPNGDSLTLPFVLQPYFATTENRTVLKNHLSGLNSDEREDYLTNLAEVVQTAKEQGADVTGIINRYFEDKATQIELAKLDRTSRLERQLYVLGAAASTIFLIALASLVLVLLAIERNTRKLSGVERA